MRTGPNGAKIKNARQRTGPNGAEGGKMKRNKLLKAVSYVVLSISILILIISIMCIAIKNSDYLNEEKYFKSEQFAFNYLMTLRDIADILIHMIV